MSEVRQWLVSLGLERYADAFEAHCIEPDQLGSLTGDDLLELGVRALGHRKRIRQAAADGAVADRPRTRSPALPDEGERKHITILFADIVGSTALIQSLDVEDSVDRLGPAVSAMVDAVERGGGTVNRIQGDGITALFGAPLTQEDHAVRACLAAIGIRDAVTALGDEGLRVRVGINTGEAMVRVIRGALTDEYEADGAAVHLAARMEQLAEPGTVRCTAETFRLAEGHVDGHSLGVLPVRGIDQPIEHFVLDDPVMAASRWEARARRGLSQFTGRDSELAILQDALALAAEGRGQIVCVVGEAGMGKSRLVHELLSSRVPDEWTVRVSAASSIDADTPFGPLRTLLRADLGIEPGDSQYRVEERLSGAFASLSPPEREIESALRELIGVRVDEPEWQSLDPAERKRRILVAFTALALHRAASAPLLLVFEDLHWSDTETLAALDALADRMTGSRILLLVTYRPEHRDRWAGRGDYRQVQVTRLGVAGAAALVNALLGDDPSVADLSRQIAEATEGCPLYIEETIRALADQGRLEGAPGRYRGTGPLNHLQVPASVEAVLAARIDRLGPETKRLLLTAAVIGRHVSLPLLASVSRLSAEALGARLHELQVGEFLYQSQVHPQAVYSFKHALTQSVAYERLLKRRRVELHGNVFDALEALHDQGSDETIEALAHHAFEGARWPRAVECLRTAVERATRQSAHTEAQRHLERALIALDQLPSGPARTRHAIDVRLDMKNMLLTRGDFPAISRYLDEAERLVEDTGDAIRRCRVLLHQCHYLWMIGEHHRSVEKGRAAGAIASEHRDRESEVECLNRLGSVYHSLGRYRDGVEVLRRAEVQVDERTDTPGLPQVYRRSFLVWNLAELGEIEEALAITEHNLEAARHSGLPWGVIDAAMGAGVAYLAAGRADEAASVLNESIRLCRDGELPMLVPWVATHLGTALVRSRQVEAGLACLDEAVEQAAAMGMWANQPLRLTRLSEAFAHGNQRDAAQLAARKAVDLARVHGERGHEALALVQLASLGREDAPHEHFRQALAIAHELGMRPLAARCREALSAS